MGGWRRCLRHGMVEAIYASSSSSSSWVCRHSRCYVPTVGMGCGMSLRSYVRGLTGDDSGAKIKALLHIWDE